MGATSVTGVSGAGSVQDGLSKGSGHMTLGVGHLIGPRVVSAGKVTLTGGATSATVDHEDLGGTTGFVVVLTADNVTGAYLTARTGSSFAFTTGANGTVNWAIVSVGASELNIN